MNGRAIGLGVIAVLAVPVGAGCSSQACTTRGCSAGFTATVQRADGSFPSGMHRVEILADAATLTCTFVFQQQALFPQCPSGLIVEVGNAQVCSETRTEDSVSLRCDPIPGQFVERITLPTTSAQVHVWQYVDDVAILDAAAAPTYQDFFPNGPACGGACRQASASWTLQ